MNIPKSLYARLCFEGAKLYSLRKNNPHNPAQTQPSQHQTQRRPGSPHSKKQTPLSPERQRDSILGSTQSTAVHHFEKGTVSTASMPIFLQAVQSCHEQAEPIRLQPLRDELGK
jgi:hypothetical protein